MWTKASLHFLRIKPTYNLLPSLGAERTALIASELPYPLSASGILDLKGV